LNKFKPKALIRVESNPEIGSGHAMRMLALASMLQIDLEIYLAFRDLPTNIKKLYKEIGVSLIRIKKSESSEELEYVSSKINGLDIIIVDGYESLDCFKKQCLKSKKKLVLIDDLIKKDIEADLIINHCPGINRSDFEPLKNSKFGLGLDYVLLQDCFLNQAKALNIFNNTREGIFVNLGSSDPENLTLKLLDILIEETDEKINCILGSLNKHSIIIKKKFRKHKQRILFYENISSNKIKDLMISSKIGVCSASTISLEAIACRLPIVIGWGAQNQINLYSGQKNLGLAKGIGNLKHLDFELMLKTTKNLLSNKSMLEDMMLKQAQYLDGKSPQRVSKAIDSLFSK